MRERCSNATNGIEHYIFQWFFHTAALRVQCEYIIEIYSNLIFFPLVALLHRPRIAFCVERPYVYTFIHAFITTYNEFFWYEPRHDKTNNVAVRPAKTQISLGIRPV